MSYVLLPTHVLLLVVVAAVLDTAPKARLPPTAPVYSTEPDPAFMINARDNPLLLRLPVKVILLAVFKLVVAPSVTALPKVWTPEVVIRPPLIAVVPVLEFCTSDVASTDELKVVVPVLVNAIAPTALVAPTVPVNVIAPVPVLIVIFRPTSPSLFTAPPKMTCPVLAVYAMARVALPLL
jgi:hypothetical protein